MRSATAQPALWSTLLTRVALPVVAFPLWWYGEGLLQAGRAYGRELSAWSDRLSLRILLRNLFRPMYGDTTRTGRAISLVLRLVLFVAHLVTFALWFVILTALVALYLTFPLATGALLIRSLVQP